MLGNDVVDLEDVDARPETFRRRFDARVFADEERRAIAQAGPASPALRWAHWAAKEAAYKLVRQADPGFVFSPGKLVARFEAATPAGAGRLERRGRLALAAAPPGLAPTIELVSCETPAFVHVVALPEGGDWASVVVAIETIDADAGPAAGSGAGVPVGGAAQGPSLAVRRLALREAARALGVAVGRLAIGRRGRVPTLELDGRPTPIPLSLSHHGRFVACAMLRPAAEARAAQARRGVCIAMDDENVEGSEFGSGYGSGFGIEQRVAQRMAG